MKQQTQTFRDNLNGDIVTPKFIVELIDTREFQRLRRIKQLGKTSHVFIGANHTRFEHSIGVFHNLWKIKQRHPQQFSEKTWQTIFAAGILHDIGHGPLSHSFEFIFKKHNIKHEKIGDEIILSPHSEVNKVLVKNNIKPSEVVAMSKFQLSPITSLLLASQIDVDRMDYLPRDAYNTGTSYGKIDVDKIIKEMEFDNKNQRIFFNYSAISALESFIFARYQAYQSIYFHRVSIIYERMIKLLFLRLKDIGLKSDNHQTKIEKIAFVWQGINLEKFLDLDDFSFFDIIHQLKDSSDKILKDLAHRILNRELFSAWDIKTNKSNLSEREIKQKIIAANFDPRYYFDKVNIKKSIFANEKNKINENKDAIYIKDKHTKKIKKIEELSSFAKSLINHEIEEKYYILPKGIL